MSGSLAIDFTLFYFSLSLRTSYSAFWSYLPFPQLFPDLPSLNPISVVQISGMWDSPQECDLASRGPILKGNRLCLTQHPSPANCCSARGETSCHFFPCWDFVWLEFGAGWLCSCFKSLWVHAKSFLLFVDARFEHTHTIFWNIHRSGS